ncbi:MAG: hypothetical protein JWN69_2338, partial [Alphaproteobacteria bacterium]|nr:hypothetical protein [Alphaproteobacteria bacterium]
MDDAMTMDVATKDEGFVDTVDR